MRLTGILIVAVILTFFVAPPVTGGPFQTPALDKFSLDCAVSSSEKTIVTVCGGADLPLQLLAQRWVGLTEFTIGQYHNLQVIAPIEVYILPYGVYEKRLLHRYPYLKKTHGKRGGIILADTYPKEKGSIIVIETFFMLDDDTFIHEIHHHILSSLSWILHDHAILERAVIRILISEAYKEWLRVTP